MTSPLDYLGTSPLFLGIETANWTLAQFQTAARNAKAIGITSLLVKIADGGNVWYGGIGNWQRVLDSVKAEGMHAIPYSYCYGNKYGAIQIEINILIAAMHYAGIAIADMEDQYNGQVGWAQTVCNALKPVSGVFGVTTWADPNEQNWQGVIAALAPCVNFWLPQVYTDNLANLYHKEYDPHGLPYYPILYLGVLANSTNDILAIAKSANSPIIGYWEYQNLAAHASAVKQAQTFVTKPPKPTPPDALARYNANGHIKQELDDCWKSVHSTLPTGSGIWKTWVALWLDRNVQVGPPLRAEYTSADSDGKPMQVLECAHARCEWHDATHYAWYGTSGRIA